MARKRPYSESPLVPIAEGVERLEFYTSEKLAIPSFIRRDLQAIMEDKEDDAPNKCATDKAWPTSVTHKTDDMDVDISAADDTEDCSHPITALYLRPVPTLEGVKVWHSTMRLASETLAAQHVIDATQRQIIIGGQVLQFWENEWELVHEDMKTGRLSSADGGLKAERIKQRHAEYDVYVRALQEELQTAMLRKFKAQKRWDVASRRANAFVAPLPTDFVVPSETF